MDGDKDKEKKITTQDDTQPTGQDGFQSGILNDMSGNVISGNVKASGVEGMQTLGFSFVAPVEINSSISNIINQQNKILSNVSTMNPYLINVDNESKLRSQMKYSEYMKH